MNNYKMIISYDGTRYQGWEHQPGKETIQGKLEGVISHLTDKEFDVIGAGRTDGGVHARGMVANVMLDIALAEEEFKDYMNQYLPDDISVCDVKIASDRFHARYNARGKTYRYSCYDGKEKPVFDRKYVTVMENRLDIDKMLSAAEYMKGTHDFCSFCKNPKMKKSTVRTVDSIEIKRAGDYVHFIFHGNGFLRNMVRIMVGTLLEVGNKKSEPERVKEILDAQNRLEAGPTAPAQGLCLMQVDYF